MIFLALMNRIPTLNAGSSLQGGRELGSGATLVWKQPLVGWGWQMRNRGLAAAMTQQLLTEREAVFRERAFLLWGRIWQRPVEI